MDLKIRKKTSTRKYICPMCLQSVRATKIVNIICGDCDSNMVIDTELDYIGTGCLRYVRKRGTATHEN